MMYGYGAGWIMVLMMLFIIIIIVLSIALFIRFLSKNNFTYTNKKALDILNERLASGEISEEEYQSKKEIIRKK